MALDLAPIRSAAQRVAASHGLDVVELEFLGGPKERVIRVFVEKNAEERARIAAADPHDLPGEDLNPEQLAGVTHEDCAVFSRDFGPLLDVEDLIPGGEYTLEVSSPGLDRKLYSVEDYRRFRGSLVKVTTFQPVLGNRHWRGRLTDVSEGSIGLDLTVFRQKPKAKKKVEDRVEIELENIEAANLIPEI